MSANALNMRVLAEYGGEGLLTCLCAYDGSLYAGCEREDVGLYTVSASGGFSAVTLPLSDGMAFGDVQSLGVLGSHLMAFGWQYPTSDRTTETRATWTIWRYDGAEWLVLSEGLVYHNLYSTRWAKPTVTADGEGMAVGLFGPEPGGGHVDADLLPWYGTLQEDGVVERSTAWAGMRGSVLLGDSVIRAISVSGFGYLFAGFEGIFDYGRTGNVYASISVYQQFLASWLGRVWGTQTRMVGEGYRQGLISTRGAGYRRGPEWSVSDFGHYTMMVSWRGRLIMFGLRYDPIPNDGETRGTYLGSPGGDAEPVYALWEPPYLTLNASMDWQVIYAEPDGDNLWLIGMQSHSLNALMADRQAVLVASRQAAIHSLETQWGDGLGANQPTLASFETQWARTYPTEVTLLSLETQWGDGLGANKPTLVSLESQWGDGHAVNQPTVESLQTDWSKAGDQRPTLVSVETQWGDGLGVNKPTLVSVETQWRAPAGDLNRASVQSLETQWGDGEGENTPTLASVETQWGDGLGANKPTLTSVQTDWSLGYTAARPTLTELETQWGDYEPRPPDSGVRVSLLATEWNDDADPTAGGEDILWLTHTADADVVGVRVVTSAVMEEGRDLQCLIRTDDSPAVDAWHTYQKFASNRTVVLEEPGTDLRIGIAKDPSVPDATDVYVQLKFDA